MSEELVDELANRIKTMYGGRYQHLIRDLDTFHIGRDYATNVLLAKAKDALYDSPQKILEFGSGVGGTTRILAKRYPAAEITTVELTPESIAYNKRTTDSKNVRYICDNILNMDDFLKTETFDLTVCEECMCHIPNHSTLIKKIYNHLESPGVFAFTDWMISNRVNDQEIRQVTEDWNFAKMDSRKSYTEMLEKSGFTVKIVENKSVEFTKKDDGITASLGEPPLQIYEKLINPDEKTWDILREEILRFSDSLDLPEDIKQNEELLQQEMEKLRKMYIKTDYMLYLIWQNRMEVSLIIAQKT